MTRKLLWLEAILYTVIGIGTPIGETLFGDRPLTVRVIVATSTVAIVGGCNALKAFLSTSFSRATGDAILVKDTAPSDQS